MCVKSNNVVKTWRDAHGRVGGLIATIFSVWWSLGLHNLNSGVARPNGNRGGEGRLASMNSVFTNKAMI